MLIDTDDNLIKIKNINKELESVENEKFKRKRLRINYNKMIIKTKQESTLMMKANETFNLNEIKNNIKLFEKKLNQNKKQTKVNDFIKKLYDFKKQFTTRKKEFRRAKIKLDSTVLKKILFESKYKSLNLKEIKQEYYKITNFNSFSITTLRRFLNQKMNYGYCTHDVLHYKTESLKNRVMNVVFFNAFCYHLSKNCYFIYVDESSFQTKVYRKKFWGDKFNRPKKFGFGRTESVNVIAGISENGLEHVYKTYENNASETYIEFLEGLKEKLEKDKIKKKLLKDKKIIIIGDNCTIHKSKEIRHYLRDSKFRQLLLPTYSPQLNGIEYFWGIIKRELSREVFFNK